MCIHNHILQMQNFPVCHKNREGLTQPSASIIKATLMGESYAGFDKLSHIWCRRRRPSRSKCQLHIRTCSRKIKTCSASPTILQPMLGLVLNKQFLSFSLTHSRIHTAPSDWLTS